jgi:hypothetical protein
MEAPRSPKLLKLLPSFTDFAFLLPVMYLFGRMDGAKSLLGDCDTGWHIRTGEWIFANHRVPLTDMFSFSRPGDPWFAWEWLADIILAGLNNAGGLRAVVLFSTVLLALTFMLLYRILRDKSNAIIAIVITVLVAAASSIHWLARPHLFTFLFLVLFYEALERVREGHTHLGSIPYLAMLPVATIVWTNLHGGFFVGILMIGAYGGGEVLRIVFSEDREAGYEKWIKAGKFFGCALACLAASLVNPYFYHLHVHIFKYLQDPFLTKHVLEYLSPNFHNPSAPFFEALLVLAAGAAFWNVSKGRYTEPLLLVMWAHSALLAGRNIPIFAIAAAIPAAKSVREWIELLPDLHVAGWVRRVAQQFSQLAARTGETESVGRWHLVSALVVAMVAAVIWAPNPPNKFHAEFDPKRYPSGALATLRSDPSARIYTDDEWGDYLIWSLYPTHKVFVDGRDDFYGEDFLERFIDVYNVKYDWEKILGRYDVDTILLATNAPLAGALKESSRWRLIFDDGVAVIFRSARKSVAASNSVAQSGNGSGRDREVTKTAAGDQAITENRRKS